MRVRLELQTDLPSQRQIATGFLMLAEMGVIDLDLSWSKRMSDTDPERSLTRVDVDGARVAYDCNDGYYFGQSGTEERLADLDYYFLRAFDPETHRDWSGSEKIHPLGLNYHVELPHKMFRDLDRANAKNFARLRARRALRLDPKPLVQTYEVEPDYSAQPTALFYARLWNPQGETPGQSVPEDVQAARVELNFNRSECVRLLRQEFGSRFTGGLEPTPYALEHHPDLVRDRSKTSKRAYLEQVRHTDICVGSLGLSDANGWKIGEYVAASRAIVNETMRYRIPGPFAAPSNYLPFTTPEECVEQVGTLLRDPEAVYEMKVRNHEYYLQYVRPDRMILRTLRIASGDVDA